jgi:hypothetical protein
MDDNLDRIVKMGAEIAELRALSRPAYYLAMIVLQSDLYVDNPDAKEQVDEIIRLTAGTAETLKDMLK